VLGTNVVFDVVENADISDDSVNVVVSSLVVTWMVLVAGMLVISLDVKASVLNAVEAMKSSTAVASALVYTVVNLVVISSAVSNRNDVSCAVDSDKVESLAVVWVVVEVSVSESPAEVGSINSGFVVVTVVVSTANVLAVDAKCEVEYPVVVVSVADWVLWSIVGNNAVGKISIVEGEKDDFASEEASVDVTILVIINSVDIEVAVAVGFVVSPVIVEATAAIVDVGDATVIKIEVDGATVVDSAVSSEAVATEVVSKKAGVILVVGAKAVVTVLVGTEVVMAVVVEAEVVVPAVRDSEPVPTSVVGAEAAVTVFMDLEAVVAIDFGVESVVAVIIDAKVVVNAVKVS
jgi:hypothetical protein